MANYLHGVETVHKGDVPKNVSEVKTSIIGIVGSPAAGWKEQIAADTPTVLTKQTDITKKFGSTATSGKLGSYLSKMYEQFTNQVPVVTVVPVGVETVSAASKNLDAGSNVITLAHTAVTVSKVEDSEGNTLTVTTDYVVTSETGEIEIKKSLPDTYKVTYTYTGGSEAVTEEVTPAPATITTGKTNIGAVVVTDPTGATTYTEGEDYTVDYATGIITLLRDIATAKKVAYQYADSVSDSDIIGSNDSTPRTGVYALLDSQTITGYTPKIIIAPGYSQKKAVADALLAVTNRLKARCYIDADMSDTDTVSKAVAARMSSSKAFGFHEKRLELLFPALKSGGETYPMSVAAAGVRARTDMDSSKGYWWSISSQAIYGFDALSVPVEYSINNSGADSQLLNAAGIVTVKNVGGLKFCGNMNSSFDSNSSGGNTDHEIFEVTMTVGDVIEESIEYYSEQRIDQPITTPWIDGLVRDVSNFLVTLTARGAIAGGRCWYDPEENAPTQLMAGHITFSYDDAATPPADRITYQRSYNVDYLANLGK